MRPARQARKETQMTLSISSNFDAGAIEVLNADDPADIRLRIRSDSYVDFA